MDEQAARLARLYREIGPDIWAYLRRRIRDPDLADELLQETFLIATRDIAALNAAASKRAWLMGIARNLLRQQFKRRARHRAVRLPDDLATDATTVEDPRVEAICSAIARLPATQREVLELRLRDDLRYAEIAEVLGIPIGTVRSRLHHTLRRLRSCATNSNCPAPTDPSGIETSAT